MESKKGAIVLLLALLALGFFAGQSSARSVIDFATLVQRGRNSVEACELCICPLVWPPQPCICMDEGSSCREGCKNCACLAGNCHCADFIAPEQCNGDGVHFMSAAHMKEMLQTPASALD